MGSKLAIVTLSVVLTLVIASVSYYQYTEDVTDDILEELSNLDLNFTEGLNSDMDTPSDDERRENVTVDPPLDNSTAPEDNGTEEEEPQEEEEEPQEEFPDPPVVPLPLVTEPDTLTLEAYNVTDDAIVIPDEDDHWAMPILSAALAEHGIRSFLGWGNGTVIDPHDISLFSSRLAITYWTEPSKAIVVSNYEETIWATSLSVNMGWPILVKGPSTNEALWTLGCIMSDQIISIGGNHIGESDNEVLADQWDVLDEVTNTGQDYLVVVNPNDDTSLIPKQYPYMYTTISDPYTPRLSAFAGHFIAHYNGIVITSNTDPEVIDADIEQAADMFDSIAYLLMLGDYTSLPPVYYWFQVASTAGIDLYRTPSDNAYGDLDAEVDFAHVLGADIDINIFHLELATGRIVAPTLTDCSRYVDRVLYYGEYLATRTPPFIPSRELGPDWNNNAVVYQGSGTTQANNTRLINYIQTLIRGRFNALDDSNMAQNTAEPGDELATDFQSSNFIVVDSDHGCPQGNSVWYDDLKPMNPCVVFESSCAVGQIDNDHLNIEPMSWSVEKETSFVYNLIGNGAMGLFAPTRNTYGVASDMVSILSGDGSGIVLNSVHHLITWDSTLGEAMSFAKSKLMDSTPLDIIENTLATIQ